MELKTTRWDVGAGDDASIATITLSRPHRHNAWTGRMHTELRHLLQQAEDDAAIRVVVITAVYRIIACVTSYRIIAFITKDSVITTTAENSISSSAT